MSLNSIGVREAKINLSKLLKRVQNGQEVIITDRKKPVGKIVPVSSKNLSLLARIEKLEEQGLLDPLPAKRRKTLPSPLPAPEGITQQYLQEGRNG
jgi:prevent-host-death family protein